jgi:hypothetical protein
MSKHDRRALTVITVIAVIVLPLIARTATNADRVVTINNQPTIGAAHALAKVDKAPTTTTPLAWSLIGHECDYEDEIGCIFIDDVDDSTPGFPDAMGVRWSCVTADYAMYYQDPTSTDFGPGYPIKDPSLIVPDPIMCDDIAAFDQAEPASPVVTVSRPAATTVAPPATAASITSSGPGEGTVADDTIAYRDVPPVEYLPAGADITAVAENPAAHLPACEPDTFGPGDCYWDATVMGNGEGRSYFVWQGEAHAYDPAAVNDD